MNAPPPRRTALAGRSRPSTPTRPSRGPGLPVMVILAVLLTFVVGWRLHAEGSDVPERKAAARGEVSMSTRTGVGVKLQVPAGWTRLSRGPDHSTWGSADRAHTVTVGSVEASAAPLAQVVREATGAAADAFPGARRETPPRSIDVPDGQGGDSAFATTFAVPLTGAGTAPPLTVVQVWRRDTKTGYDVVATWTSADEHWPVEPTRAIPQSHPSIR